MGVTPADLTTPEQGRNLSTRKRQGEPEQGELEQLRARIEAARDASKLPGATNHCFDCFRRGVAAAIKAIEGDPST